MAINKKLIHFNTFENFNSKKLSANAENTQYTLGTEGTVQTGSPDILYQSIVYIKDTKLQWTHGLLYDSAAWEEITYSELKSLVDSSLLIPGKCYAITDYSCIYILPVSNEETEVECPDVKYIICTAISNSELDKSVLYVRHEGYPKILECYYDIDSENIAWTTGMTTKSPKGAVWYMRDEFENEFSYDGKHVKFRRWAILDITPNTTPDDGATYPCSPFKVYCTDTAKPWSDNRFRIGSGEQDDINIINGIFSGNLAQCSQEWKNLLGESSNFSSEYVTTYVKPYQNASYPNDKYLAWQPNMNASGALSPRSVGSGMTASHMAVISTDSADYRDCYTFDLNGLDASDFVVSGSPKISHTLVRQKVLKSKSLKLPNTVILGSLKLTEETLNIRHINLGEASDNTILLRNSLYQPSNTVLTNFYVEYFFLRNLIITDVCQNVRFEYILRNNLFIASMFNFKCEGSYQYGMMVGYYSKVKLGTSDHNLLYGTDGAILLEGESSARSVDGTWTYELDTLGNFYANIFGPTQYCRLSSHFNTNTLRAPYVKGVTFHGANLASSWGNMRWGTEIGYGSGLGLKYQKMYGVKLSPHAFGSQIVTNSNGLELMFRGSNYTIPDLAQTDVNGYYTDSALLSNMSAEDLELLSASSNVRKTLFVKDGVWKFSYANDILNKVNTDGSITNIIKVTALPDNPDPNTLYVIMEEE